MEKQIEIVQLDSIRVQLRIKEMIEIDGVLKQVGGSYRKLFNNSEDGRVDLKEYLGDGVDYRYIIEKAWGNEPTVKN